MFALGGQEGGLCSPVSTSSSFHLQNTDAFLYLGFSDVIRRCLGFGAGYCRLVVLEFLFNQSFETLLANCEESMSMVSSFEAGKG